MFKEILEKLLEWVGEKFGVTKLSEINLATELDTRAIGTGLEWKTSVVDFLNLIGLDSSPAAREKLGKELGIEGKPGSAKYNEALRKAVFAELQKNGGTIPPSIL